MNAPVRIRPENDVDIQAMEAVAARWRGECIQAFAELEEIVASLLLSLARRPGMGGKVQAGQPIAAAFGHLRELTGSKGALAARGQAIRATLAQLAPWFEWRAHLTHGSLAVWRGRERQWLLTLAHRAVGDATMRTHAITWTDAQAMRGIVTDGVAALRGNARSLLNSLEKRA